ncbi:MAG TPA: GntR family transcriptional regulator [Burkholderiales bacterium]|jgi:DNA-binding GntR family transcriptional regulator
MPATQKVSALAAQVAPAIIAHARRQGLRAGDRLPEQALADALGVSRFPVRAALQLLGHQGVLEHARDRGFRLKLDAEAIGVSSLALPRSELEQPYQRILDDYLAGRLPESFTAVSMQRAYGLSRDRLLKIAGRMVEEGWVVKRHGHGWAFVQMAASVEAHRQNYLFRLALEPAALLDPGYRVDRAAFAQLRERQLRMIDGGVRRMTKLELIQAGAEFHETIVGCSGNSLFIDAIRRANRLRRLAEYRSRSDRSKIPEYCREHLAILDRIESGDRAAAAEMLRRHLGGVRDNRTGGER